MKDKLTFCMAGLTHPGLVRQDNQDNFHVAPFGTQGQVLAVVADGVGAYYGGDEAARLAVTRLPLELARSGDTDGAAFMDAVIRTHNIIYEGRFANPAWLSMCCVWTAVLFDTEARQLHLGHLGDTRLYAFAGNRLIKLSHDHSYVGTLEEKGLVSEVQAMRHPRRNVIERVAADFPLEQDSSYYQTATLPLAEGITYLLCSDGLTDMVTSAELIDILSAVEPVQAKAQRLVDAANRAGGRDNVTVVLAHECSVPTADTASVMQSYAHYARTGYGSPASPQ